MPGKFGTEFSHSLAPKETWSFVGVAVQTLKLSFLFHIRQQTVNPFSKPPEFPHIPVSFVNRNVTAIERKQRLVGQKIPQPKGDIELSKATHRINADSRKLNLIEVTCLK